MSGAFESWLLTRRGEVQTPNSKRSMPVFLDQQTMGVVSSSFPYLIPKQAEVKVRHQPVVVGC